MTHTPLLWTALNLSVRNGKPCSSERGVRFLKRTVVSFWWSHMRDEEARTTPSAPTPYRHLSTLTLRQTKLSGIGPSLVDIPAQVQPCLSRIRIWPLGYCSFSPWQMGRRGEGLKQLLYSQNRILGLAEIVQLGYTNRKGGKREKEWEDVGLCITLFPVVFL